MVTCLCDVVYPEVASAAVRVLERCGITVDYPKGQTCCGQPAYNSGYQDEARRVARSTLRAFAHSDYVVTPSGSCATMIRRHYPELFRGQPEQSAAITLASRTHEICRFLTDVVGATRLPIAYPAVATFHPSCHARRFLGADVAARRLLEMVEGLELLPLEREQDCCGFGGTFSVKMPSVSAAMVSEKADHVLATGADLLLGVDMGCLLNIQSHLQKRGVSLPVRHVMQILDAGWTA